MALAVPILTTLGFSAVLGWAHVQDLTKLRNLGSVVILADGAGALIHDLQIERGLSVGYLNASRPEDHEAELRGQWAHADAEHATFTSFLNTTDVAHKVSALADPLEHVEAELAVAHSGRARQLRV